MISISVAEMRAADQYTIAKGTPSKELMRRAAQGVFDAFSGWAEKKTIIICGSGNNGGDGYALAAIMKDQGLDSVLLRVSEKFSEDGRFYFEECMNKGVASFVYGTDPVSIADYDIIVDCMLGTGFTGVPRDPIASVIKEINRAREEHGAFVISVDINSGMNGDTGEAETAVASDLTVSIGYFKNGFFRGKASELIGSLVNADIGIELEKGEEKTDYSNERRFVQSFIRKNRRDRILHELTTPEKRYDGVSRFCHQAKELLDPSRIIMEGEDLDRRPEFERFVRQHDEICFVLTPDLCTEEQFLPLRDAVQRAVISLDAFIIMGSTFAIVFGEPMKGGRGKYLLSEK